MFFQVAKHVIFNCFIVMVSYNGLFQYPEYPSKMFFLCEIERVRGGKIPIVLNHIVYERMKDKHPKNWRTMA